MAAAVARAPHLVDRAATPPPHLSLNTTPRGAPAAVPNKHIPTCPPGPQPAARGLETPPASPAQKSGRAESASLLYPPDESTRISDDPVLYSLTAAGLARAIEQTATQPLPDPKSVFPWLHGLHAENQIQLAFFVARRPSLRKVPRCLRGVTVVKAGGDLGASRLKGAVGPGELLVPSPYPGDSTEFLETDPREGFSVRNFQIQTAKVATVSDIVVYGDDRTDRGSVMRLAQRLSLAQRNWRERNQRSLGELNMFNTFVVTDPFRKFEENHPELVGTDARGDLTGNVMDFFFWERLEMMQMSTSSEISSNVFLGPTPDSSFDTPNEPDIPDQDFDVAIETSDMAQIPDQRSLNALRSLLQSPAGHSPISIEFPSSGSIMPPTWSHAEVDGLMSVCRWIYQIANPTEAHLVEDDDDADDDGSCSDGSDSPDIHDNHNAAKDADGDSMMVDSPPPSDQTQEPPPRAQRVLIHCTDGYTESSLLGLAYFMYAEGLPAHDAWVQLHRHRGRNFFAYASDVALLTTIQPRILAESPRCRRDARRLSRGTNGTGAAEPLLQPQPTSPAWLARIDGSLPSRVLPYMYLGNLNHANNPQLLRELGISRVLSVGEPLAWTPLGDGANADDGDVGAVRGGEEGRGFRAEDLLYIDRVQDNGVDPLTEEFERCLKFIEQGKRDGTATLVHCRVGVSRSATICIAEVMNELGLSFPRAYCFVRARRLNVIIQPHLRFVYELLKWEEHQRQRRGQPLRRELEWATVAREIALMNKPYSRQ